MAVALRFLIKELGEDYPQTWYFVTGRGRRITGIIQYLCGLFIDHNMSETEWGYGGGEYAHRWCRWCNERFEVPKDSIRFEFKDSGSLMNEVGSGKYEDGIAVTKNDQPD